MLDVSPRRYIDLWKNIIHSGLPELRWGCSEKQISRGVCSKYSWTIFLLIEILGGKPCKYIGVKSGTLRYVSEIRTREFIQCTFLEYIKICQNSVWHFAILKCICFIWSTDDAVKEIQTLDVKESQAFIKPFFFEHSESDLGWVREMHCIFGLASLKVFLRWSKTLLESFWILRKRESLKKDIKMKSVHLVVIKGWFRSHIIWVDHFKVSQISVMERAVCAFYQNWTALLWQIISGC